MRLPLNNGGLINLDTPGTSAVIFNTQDLLNDGSGVSATDQVFLVTIFAYPAPYTPVGDLSPTSTLSIIKDGTPLLAGGVQCAIPALNTSQRLNGLGPIQMCDRLACRGDMVLEVGHASKGIAGKISFFGYYERAGEQEVPGHYRPLQPSNNLQEPFTPDWPGFVLTAQGGFESGTLHLFDAEEERLDLVTLNFTAFDQFFGAGDAYVDIIWPDGNRITLEPLSPVLPLTLAFVPLLQDFPMKALANDTLDYEVQGSTVPLGGASLYVDGRFTRS